MRNGTMRKHVDGVNALQAVPWRINERVLKLVEWRQRAFGDVVKHVPSPSPRIRFEEDIETAKRLVGTDFYTPMNCDFRGRVNPMPDFQFGREDYVRALFLFADGQPIGDGFYRLMVHAANMADGCDDGSAGISKQSPTLRADWVNRNRERILATADRPEEHIDWWWKADKPFMFLAACFELAAVHRGPDCITHLPVSADASCSGLQHMAAMARSGRDGFLVNLLPGVARQDCYQIVTDIVKALLQDDPFWTNQGITRKLTKKLVMTYPYAATQHTFWGHIEEYFDDAETEIEREHAVTFAKATWKAIGTILDKPPKVMKQLQALAALSTKHGVPLRWITPTGFPCAGRYYDVHTDRKEMLRGLRVQPKIAVGYESTIKKDKARSSASANFVQSMDAAHLILTVNAAVAADIKNLAMVHDSFGCPAPQAQRLNEIIRKTFSNMYLENDVLEQIRASVAAAIGTEDGLPEPFDYGNDLDLMAIRKSTYATNT
jgi:DNA-directed RNA polymerase